MFGSLFKKTFKIGGKKPRHKKRYTMAKKVYYFPANAVGKFTGKESILARGTRTLENTGLDLVNVPIRGLKHGRRGLRKQIKKVATDIGVSMGGSKKSRKVRKTRRNRRHTRR